MHALAHHRRLALASGIAALALLTTGCAAPGSAPEPAGALWDAGSDRDKVVVISDLHLGIDDRYAETIKNRPILIEFLQRLQATSDVRELVIAGDFLDEWYLPVDYPAYTDQAQFYRDVIANNQAVIDELNNVADSGIKLVYVIGNHDMTLEAEILQEALPSIEQPTDAKGLGVYVTGDRDEIVVEHGHRYDVFSAPDTVTNAALCDSEDTIFPAGYFYARYGATWVLEGSPEVPKDLPVVTHIPDPSDTDQYDAYLYYSTLKKITEHITPTHPLDAPIFDMRVAGFCDAYTFLDFYPAEQADGTISAPVLFQDVQRTWEERQRLNNVKVPTTFADAVTGAIQWTYFFDQAKAQYLEHPSESVDVVVFGHTHGPVLQQVGDGKLYLNSGTWIDHNSVSPTTPRTFTVITAGERDTAVLYSYGEDGTLTDIGEGIAK